MRGIEEGAIYMGAGMAKLYGMMSHGDYRRGIGPALRKEKKAKRKQEKQSRRKNR